MDIEFNCYILSKVNGNCVYVNKFRKKCLIYEVKFSMCEAIYIDNTHQTPNKTKDGTFFCLLCPIKNGKKLD